MSVWVLLKCSILHNASPDDSDISFVGVFSRKKDGYKYFKNSIKEIADDCNDDNPKITKKRNHREYVYNDGMMTTILVYMKRKLGDVEEFKML